jgi:hypothetical protein
MSLTPEVNGAQYMQGQAPMMQGLMGSYMEQSKNAVREDAGADGQGGFPLRPRLKRRRAGFGQIQAMNDVVATPKVGFCQSLGCPKALTDSELILTQLSAEGYATSKTFAGADLVIVNTCGFIDDAVKESLDTIGEALAENGKVIVTGCLGAKQRESGGNLVQPSTPRCWP